MGLPFYVLLERTTLRAYSRRDGPLYQDRTVTTEHDRDVLLHVSLDLAFAREIKLMMAVSRSILDAAKCLFTQSYLTPKLRSG